MSATISDHFNKASDMSGAYPTVATVSATRSAGATTLSCDDLGGWATDTPVHFSTFQVNTDGSIDTTTQTDWKGIVSGNSITDLVRLAGAADSGNASGDRVELNPTIGWLDDLVKGILVSHLQDGTLKDGIVSTAKLADDAVTSAKIADDAVTNDHIADGAIDSYAKIADATILSRNIDFSSMKKWVPDYSNATSLGNVSSYTATADGWVVVHYYGYNVSSTYTATIKVNNKVVYSDTTEADAPNGARASQGDIMIQVSSGDTVVNETGNKKMLFVPGKWA